MTARPAMCSPPPRRCRLERQGTPEKLSPPQKRRGRLQRAAASNALADLGCEYRDQHLQSGTSQRNAVPLHSSLDCVHDRLGNIERMLSALFGRLPPPGLWYSPYSDEEDTQPPEHKVDMVLSCLDPRAEPFCPATAPDSGPDAIATSPRDAKWEALDTKADDIENFASKPNTPTYKNQSEARSVTLPHPTKAYVSTRTYAWANLPASKKMMRIRNKALPKIWMTIRSLRKPTGIWLHTLHWTRTMWVSR